MSYAPNPLTAVTMPVISTLSPDAVLQERVGAATIAPVSVAWPTANQAIYLPFAIPSTATFKRGYVYNGATAAGSWDVGIYNEAGTRLASSGAVVMAGINVIQVLSLTANVTLTPGRYYMGLSNTLATATVFGNAVNVTYRRSGLYTQATANPLPSTATFATWTSQILPYFGISQYAF